MSEHDNSYLWDKSGPVDAEIERLETLLAPYRLKSAPPLPRPATRRPVRVWLYAGAAIAAAFAVAWFSVRRTADDWTVAVLAGEARLDSRAVSGSARMQTGEVFETETGAQARIRMPRGRLDVEPDTALRLLESGRNTQRISLLRGTIHARVMAPPRVFIVDTPSAVATDLGCAYTLHVEPSGDGMLRVTHGWIELAWKGSARASLVPTGAVAQIRAGKGPGTPFFEDTSAAFREALSTYDFPADARQGTLHQVLSVAGSRDAVSLLNLVRNVQDGERSAVYDTLARVVPPPAGANRDAVIAGDPHALDAWWQAVGVGHAPR